MEHLVSVEEGAIDSWGRERKKPVTLARSGFGSAATGQACRIEVASDQYRR
jgi:hypothetical protein